MAAAAAAAAAMAEQEGARNGARNRGGVQRVEGKLRASVEKGDYYEAHQMYRTLFFRYMSQSKHAEARELMYSGALLFFSHGQQNSAADLSMLVLESLEKAEVDVADDLLENLAKVFSLMDPNSPERVAFVSRALKWSSGGSGKLGHPRLHQLLALTLWKEQNYCESRYHFLHSTDGEGCANMLVEYSTARGFRSEVDMFVAQAVLQKPAEQPHGLLRAGGGGGEPGRQQPHRAGLSCSACVEMPGQCCPDGFRLEARKVAAHTWWLLHCSRQGLPCSVCPYLWKVAECCTVAWRCVTGMQLEAPAADCVPSARSTIKHRPCCVSLCRPCLWFLGEGCRAGGLVSSTAHGVDQEAVATRCGLSWDFCDLTSETSFLFIFLFRTWGHFVVMVSLSLLECVSCRASPCPLVFQAMALPHSHPMWPVRFLCASPEPKPRWPLGASMHVPKHHF
nr:Golgi to ER traffic protein 4 homolog isoform X2 [Cavia porcellus]